jgi:hypothetical protein
MNKPDPNLVRDARQQFDLTGTTAAGNSLATAAKPVRVKVFKSGNSLAVRMPKALGLEAGMELQSEVQPMERSSCAGPNPCARSSISVDFGGRPRP